MATKITTAHIKAQIPLWITDDTLAELKEAWDENNEDCDPDPLRDAIDFVAHVREGKNWKRVHKSKIGSDIHRVFELGPGPIFGGIFKVEVITDGTDSTVLHTLFYNE